MCRHAAWLGAPRALTALIQEPPHGLLTQSYRPRRQRHGTVNADGFGMGWYAAARAAAAFQRLRAGLALGDALSEVVVKAAAKDPSARLNLLACDGAALAATVWGDTLFHRLSEDGVLVASEPLDDLPGWQAVPERSLLLATTSDGVRVQPL